MPNYVIKQPDGKYARFSTVVDDFYYGNMTRDEMIDSTRDEWGGQVAEEKVQRADEDANASYMDHSVPKGQRRWLGALLVVQGVHGEAIAQRRALLIFDDETDEE